MDTAEEAGPRQGVAGGFRSNDRLTGGRWARTRKSGGPCWDAEILALERGSKRLRSRSRRDKSAHAYGLVARAPQSRQEYCAPRRSGGKGIFEHRPAKSRQRKGSTRPAGALQVKRR